MRVKLLLNNFLKLIIRIGGDQLGIQVGIIGCGSIAKNRHAPEYISNRYVSNIVFYDRNPERAKALADQFGGSIAKSVDRKSTRLNSSHVAISYAVFCLKKESH